MLRLSPNLSYVDRGQLGVAASQVEVGTSQIEAGRSQYAIRLNNVIEDAAPLFKQLSNVCIVEATGQFATPCIEAKRALTEMGAAVRRGQSKFTPYKQQVQAEIDRQEVMIHQIDG
jgi:hypothetical protein